MTFEEQLQMRIANCQAQINCLIFNIKKCRIARFWFVLWFSAFGLILIEHDVIFHRTGWVVFNGLWYPGMVVFEHWVFTRSIRRLRDCKTQMAQLRDSFKIILAEWRGYQ